MTAALVGQIFPGCSVTCVDRCDEWHLPHYKEAGLGNKIQFVKLDMLKGSPYEAAQKALVSRSKAKRARERGEILGKHEENCATADKFLDAMAGTCRKAAKQYTAVVAVHCCGPLSNRAIDVFARVQADVLLLLPCCLPSKTDALYPSSLFAVPKQEEQYARWACYLRDEAKTIVKPQDDSHWQASVKSLKDIMSVKSTLVSVWRKDVTKTVEQ